MKDPIFIKNAVQEVAEKLKNWKDAAIRKEITPPKKKTKIGRISYAAWSGITNGESIEWSATKITRMIGIYGRLQIFYDPDLLSSYDVPTFLIKLLLPQVQESLAAMLECREIHERIWVSPETLSIVNMLDEILVNHTMIREIWRHYWRLWEKKEIENSGSEEPLQSIPLPCFSVRAKREKVHATNKSHVYD